MQKLLDRILFCAFAEDRGLLPDESIQRAFTHADPYNPRPIYQNFLGLFRSIDLGNDRLKIARYNGDLFAPDPLLDGLNVPDEVCGLFARLAEYDYRPPQEAGDDADEEGDHRASAGLVDVDILGHIFEQSISDLETLRGQFDAETTAMPAPVKGKAKTRRRKEGAFYTPPFITRYIVGEALSRVLADRFEALPAQHETKATGTATATLADPRVYDLAALNIPQRAALVGFWEAWQERLRGVRVVDPACGSGAFLIEAFDQLYAAFVAGNARLEELRGHRTLFDLDRQILQNNLYGVDLNAEAVQICRLSVWIKTAQRGKVLTDLDHTIRVGDSLIDDPGVHLRAFKWEEAFPKVFGTAPIIGTSEDDPGAGSGAGFDAVIGNPPTCGRSAEHEEDRVHARPVVLPRPASAEAVRQPAKRDHRATGERHFKPSAVTIEAIHRGDARRQRHATGRRTFPTPDRVRGRERRPEREKGRAIQVRISLAMSWAGLVI